MKFALVLFSVFLVVVQSANAFDKDVFMKLGQKCKEATKTSDEDVQKIMQKQMPESREAKCMMACIFKEMGILTADGKYNAEGNEKAAQAAFGNDEEKLKRAKQFSAACKDKVESAADSGDGCDRAGVMFACAMEKAKELGMDKA